MERLIEVKKSFKRTESEAVPTVFPTHLKYDLMPKDVLGKVRYYHISFYPTALKGCQGIFFTHGVRMGGQAAGKSLSGCISETVRCKNLILGRDIGWGVGVQRHGLTLI